MTSISVKRNNLGVYYQCALAVAFVFVFFTDAANHFYNVGIAPSPKLSIAGFSVLAVPLLFSLVSRFKFFPVHLMKWCGLYLAVSSLSFLLFFQSEVAYQELKNRLLSVFLIALGLLVFSGDKQVEKWAKYAVLGATVLAVLNNILELVNLSTFGGLNETGRPAGFYENPNKAGCALLLGLILSSNIVPRRYRLLWIGLVSVGVLLTFSRGATLSLLVIIGIFYIQKIISRKQLILVTITIIVLISAFGLSSNFLTDQAEYLGLNKNAVERLEIISNSSYSQVNEDTSRVDVASFSLNKFFDRPFLGYGIGYTQTWSEVSPHNIYLLHIVEHGFLGIFLFPLLVLSVVRGACRDVKYLGIAFVVFMLIWGVFSHNMIDDRYILLSFSLMASMTARSKLEKNLENQSGKHLMNTAFLGKS